LRIALLARCAGIVAGNEEQRESQLINRFGYLLGFAFQITDDVLKLKGNVVRYGKEINGDLWGRQTDLLRVGYLVRRNA
jgi:geranylgeranyl diphosphate synthase, type II